MFTIHQVLTDGTITDVPLLDLTSVTQAITTARSMARAPRDADSRVACYIVRDTDEHILMATPTRTVEGAGERRAGPHRRGSTHRVFGRLGHRTAPRWVLSFVLAALVWPQIPTRWQPTVGAGHSVISHIVKLTQ